MTVSAIVDKVQKLLALSKSSNANEAAAAAAKANKLIDQYRLSEADLETEATADLEPLEEDPDYVYQSGKVTPWKKLLVNVLAAHYGCAYWNDRTYVNGRQFSRYRLVGKRSDIGITRYMYSWLLLECQRLSEKEAKGMGRIFVGSYCEGFVIGVANQLKLSRAEVQKDATATAIVKIDARAQVAKSFLYQLHTNLVQTKQVSARQRDGLAFSLGQNRGQNMHLGASMAASGGTKLLGK